MILGVILAIGSALGSTLRETARKHVSEDFSSVKVGYLAQIYASLLLLPLAAWKFFKVGIGLNIDLILAVLVSTGAIISSTYLFIEAMRISDFSVTEPLRKLSPIFVAILEPLVLGINFSPRIAFGAVLGAGGSYILVSKDSLLKPLETIRNKGALVAILVAFILSLWAIAMRFAATHTNQFIFIFLIAFTSLLGFQIWMLKRGETVSIDELFRRDVFGLGFFTAIATVAGIFAYTYLSASEVTILKQTSAIFGIIIGGSLFKEENLLRKFVGTLTIILGAAIILV